MIDLKYSEILAQNKMLRESVRGNKYTISILANVTVNPLIELIEYSCRLKGINPLVKIGNYDNIAQDSATHTKSDLVLVFYDIFKIINELPFFFEDISDEMLSGLNDRIYSEFDIIYKNLESCPSVVINTFSSQYFSKGFTGISKIELFVFELNLQISQKRSKNVSFINLDTIFSTIGIHQAIDYRLYYASKALYTISFFKYYLQALEPTILRNTGKLKKAIIFDCDNTLWNGILGEDGFSGIDMSLKSGKGFAFNKIQQIARFLSNNGVIVGLCSKNNEADVVDVINNHADMVLKDENIVVKKINWNDKATNLKEIATELNIGLDSIVFIDDSDFEINLIKEIIPEIKTIRVPNNLLDYQKIMLDYIFKYFNLSVSNEDKLKTKMYKQQANRIESKSNAESIDDYLKSLDIVIKVFENDESFVPRISQMTQKTNQFNLTTKRYTENQISNFLISEDSSIFAISVSDKFGDNGITGALICDFDKVSNIVEIDTFLMSCRIIGRNVEFVFFDFFVKKISKMGYAILKASYIPTKKNEQVKGLYESFGFEISHIENEKKEYILNVANYRRKNLDYIKIG